MLRSKFGLSVSAALLLGAVSITGCGANNTATGNVETKSVRGTDGRIHVNSVQNGMRAGDFDSMEVSKELADRVAAMPEVRSANVMLVGKSAYVAVMLENASGGVHAKGTRGVQPYSFGSGTAGMLGGSGRPGGLETGIGAGMGGNVSGTGRGTAAGNPGMTGTGGSIAGIPGNLTGTGTVGGTGMTDPANYPGNGNNGIMSGNNMVDGSRLKQDIDESMGRRSVGIRSVTPDNGTQVIRDNDTLTQDLKDKIADQVKKSNPDIKNVYVSANPDFVERADYYAREFRAGHPLKGFANEFRTMVERIFPTRSGY
ncbi:YhcN/YlaJ family sporulation lipoprotein [Paenibacillus sp. MMS20-IR301]|uniref:YhcN/YlaJ family sporulation lipoprotein n=1 Tax=Paenibacillus sp. MMS20-IR301 TaxID=2895946 RepID=UPI0028E1DD71|nr:YhcN/YlaJ family sporulation lipoprotein [Paenibacillus sp. MMS20-IR301]WNS43403.1 YhcN/YlaJ family sporulation lipoprotein [Paenibacillus sp. MMS20-IR301]